MWNRLAVEAEVSESMLTRFLEDTAFGPDEIAIMVIAYEMGLTQINASGDNDPTAETLAQTIVMLAKQGERDPVRLEQRAIEIMAGHFSICVRPSGGAITGKQRNTCQGRTPNAHGSWKTEAEAGTVRPRPWGTMPSVASPSALSSSGNSRSAASNG